ncbi:MAG TPA: haloacid dehalogenase type II [Roseiarcus sp.]|nr:haloacid dehalogenase type II [Roseiarcus sp.]
MNTHIAGVVFDAYGTLLDIYAVEAQLEALYPGKGRALSLSWRDKQIEYSRLRTMSGRYADFWSITGDGLDYACEFEKVALTSAARDELMAIYERLPAHPEVPAALSALHAKGLKLAVLSNGNEAMLHKALAAAGIEPLFSHVLSVERVRKFKTAPEAYQLALDAFGAPVQNLVFVSSNGWDAAGAAWFGFRTFWINRAGAPLERLGVAPEGIGRTMDDLTGFLAA